MMENDDVLFDAGKLHPPFSDILTGFFDSVRGKIRNVMMDEDDERKRGKLHVIMAVHDHLLGLEPSQFDGMTDEEMISAIKAGADGVIRILEEKRQDDALSLEYRRGMKSAIDLFNGRLAVLAAGNFFVR